MTTAVATKPEEALFVAARFELSLTKEPIRAIRNPSDGTIMDKTEGVRINFTRGMFETADAELLAWLRRHPLYGDRNEGFWEQDRPVPEPSKEEIAALLDAATAFDVPALEEILAAEEAGYQREKMLDLARGTIIRVKAALEQAQEK